MKTSSVEVIQPVDNSLDRRLSGYYYFIIAHSMTNNNLFKTLSIQGTDANQNRFSLTTWGKYAAFLYLTCFFGLTISSIYV